MSDGYSKWATAATPEPEPVDDVDTDIEDIEPTGPTEPTHDVEPPDALARLPYGSAPARNGGKHWYVSASGGAGATTLATLDDNGFDANGSWPFPWDDGKQNVVLVAHETVPGLTAARLAGQHWESGDLHPINILAIITIPAQPGKMPPAIANARNLAVGLFPREYRTEWHPDYMNYDDPRSASPSKRTERIIRTINRISTKEG